MLNPAEQRLLAQAPFPLPPVAATPSPLIRANAPPLLRFNNFLPPLMRLRQPVPIEVAVQNQTSFPISKLVLMVEQAETREKLSSLELQWDTVPDTVIAQAIGKWSWQADTPGNYSLQVVAEGTQKQILAKSVPFKLSVQQPTPSPSGLRPTPTPTPTQTPFPMPTPTPTPSIQPTPSAPCADALPCVSPTPTPTALAMAEVVFTSSWDGNDEIYRMNIDGSNPRRLTNDPAPDIQPKWSPNGKFIVFTSYRSGNGELYLLELATNQMTQLTNHPAEDGGATWSPDSSRLVFHSNRDSSDGNFDIYELQLAGGNLRKVVSGPGDDMNPSLSPDGLQVVFSSNRGNINNPNHDLYRGNVNGENVQKLTDTNDDDERYPSWSPLNSDIAFQLQIGTQGRTAVYVMPASGGTRTPISSTTAAAGRPTWSGDGRKVLYVSAQDGVDELYICTLNEPSSNKRLTNNTSVDTWPHAKP